MKNYLVLLFLLTQPLLFAQNLTGIVIYDQFLLSDTISSLLLKQSATLLFDISKSNSIYFTRRKQKNEIENNPVTRREDGSILFVRQKNLDEIGEIYYKSQKNKELIYRDFIGFKPFIVTDMYPQIIWEISASKKNILGFECQKAEGDFRGRHYTAWFTNKIPISDGPWKLCGLPGLILEASDTKKQVRFELQSIEFPKNFEERIVVPIDGDAINFNDYFKSFNENVDKTIKKFIANTEDMKGVSTNGKPRKANFIERD